MTHLQFIDALADRFPMTKGLAAAVLGNTFSTIVDEVKRSGRVAIPGFGVFYKKCMKGRRILNPSTGKPMRLPPMESIGFRAAKAVKTTKRR